MKKLQVTALLASSVVILMAMSAHSGNTGPASNVCVLCYHAFDFFHDELEKTKKADQETVQRIANEFDRFVTGVLRGNPRALEVTGTYGLTPAHLLVLDFLLFLRGLHHRGSEAWNGQEDAHRKLFNHAFQKLVTDKAVIALRAPGEDEFRFSYLEPAGITHTAMTATELRDKLHDKLLL